jgi:hypothetical protein
MLDHHAHLAGASDFLTDELRIGAMVRAIAPLRNYDIRGLRLLAYLAAKIPVGDIDKFDARAVDVSRIHRRAMGYRNRSAA